MARITSDRRLGGQGLEHFALGFEQAGFDDLQFLVRGPGPGGVTVLNTVAAEPPGPPCDLRRA